MRSDLDRLRGVVQGMGSTFRLYARQVDRLEERQATPAPDGLAESLTHHVTVDTGAHTGIHTCLRAHDAVLAEVQEMIKLHDALLAIDEIGPELQELTTPPALPPLVVTDEAVALAWQAWKDSFSLRGMNAMPRVRAMVEALAQHWNATRVPAGDDTEDEEN